MNGEAGTDASVSTATLAPTTPPNPEGKALAAAPPAGMMDELIPLVNRLQDLVFNTIGNDTLDLPQVVVVGSQSSGKSSVLENLVGREFLPRGTGIVTRRPLVLQLMNTKSKDDVEAEWAEFTHRPAVRYTDFGEVKQEIEAETTRLAGHNKGISRQPINLKVFSPHVLNLTLVDLPGLTKIPIGDQPSDIERQVRTLIYDYIAKPNSIILAVTPANMDLVNSEGLKLARHVDPQGRRTIGVLTKLDLMDPGTNALEILTGRVYPLRLGFIGVVNRSQQDIQSGRPLREALAAEAKFFRSVPAYSNIAERCGTPYLAKTLSNTLMAHIRDRLPELKARITTLINQTKQELHSYGDNAQFSGNRGALILQLLTKFASRFVSSIEGTAPELSTKELYGGARIYYIFDRVFGHSLKTVVPAENLSVRDVRTAIRNATGPRASLFVPELAFDLLVKPQIALLEAPSVRCVELVYDELVRICNSCGNTELERFPRLHAKLIEVVSDLLRERLGPTSQYVESLIQIQQAYINTSHPDFVGGAGAVSSVLSRRQREQQERHMDDIDAHASDTQLSMKASTGNDSTISLHPRSASQPPISGHHRHGSVSRAVSGSVRNGMNGDAGSDTSKSSGPQQPRDSFLTYFFGNNREGGQTEREPDITRPLDTSSSSEMHENLQAMDLDRNQSESMEDALSERDHMDAELILHLITSYFNIVRQTVQDQVPKAIMHLLVNFSKSGVQNRLVTELYREGLFEYLLHEDESLVAEREKCSRMLEVYQNANKIISEIL